MPVIEMFSFIRVMLGLNTLLDLIVLRPLYGTQCLQILLGYTIHKGL